MKRSSWKLPFIKPFNYKIKNIKRKKIQFFKRDFLITKNLIGLNLTVYNGSSFLKNYINNYHIGHKLGEISFSKRCDKQRHVKKKVKKKTKKS